MNDVEREAVHSFTRLMKPFVLQAIAGAKDEPMISDEMIADRVLDLMRTHTKPSEAVSQTMRPILKEIARLALESSDRMSVSEEDLDLFVDRPDDGTIH